MAPSHLRVEHSPAGYRRLLLSRPERRNALDVGLAQALRDALGQDRATPVAVGGGAQLAAAADLRIAGPAARLRWTGPAGRGLAVGAWVLTDLVGRGTAMELALTGRWVHAGEALAMGLVNQVEDDPSEAAAALAAELAAQGPGISAKVKSVTAAGGLLDRLYAERQANRSAWAQATTPAGG